MEFCGMMESRAEAEEQRGSVSHPHISFNLQMPADRPPSASPTPQSIGHQQISASLHPWRTRPLSHSV